MAPSELGTMTGTTPDNVMLLTSKPEASRLFGSITRLPTGISTTPVFMVAPGMCIPDEFDCIVHLDPVTVHFSRAKLMG